MSRACWPDDLESARQNQIERVFAMKIDLNASAKNSGSQAAKH